MKENGFTLAKARSRWYPAGTITDADYADDIALLVNRHAKAESLLHSLEKAAGSMSLHVTVDKTEYMCFNQNQKGDISTLKSGPLKLVDKFTHFGSGVLSIENDINNRLAKARSAINRLSVIWRSDPSDKIKRYFSGSSRVHATIWIHLMDADKAYREKAWQQLQKNAASYNEQILDATSHKTSSIRPPPSHLENHPNKTNKTCWTLLEK